MQSRPLLPAPESRQTESAEFEQNGPSRAPTKVACERCRRQKTRCDGVRPDCDRCQKDSARCEYLAGPNESRSTSLRRQSQAQQERIDLLNDLLRILSEKSEGDVLEIVRRLRSIKSDQDLQTLVDFLRTGDVLVKMSTIQKELHIPAGLEPLIRKDITQFIDILYVFINIR